MNLHQWRLLFASAAVAVVHARVRSYVNIHMPNHLYKNSSGYEHRLNHFGYSAMESGSHRYFGSLALQLVDAHTDLCHIGDAAPDAARTPPFMLLASRGNCTFVTKARHAQQAGAAGLVIADDRCLCGNGGEGCNSTLPCQEEMPVLADDGSGGSLSIPVVLLKKQDAAAIYTTLNHDKKAVLLDLKWHPQAITEDEPLYYGMWVDLHDNHTAGLMQQVKPLALSLAQSQEHSYAHFWPSFMLFNGTTAQCLGNTAEDQCFQTCTNNGRYCYPSHHAPGAHIVTEILHRLCIWKHHGQNPETKDDGTAWWEYVTYFDQTCRVHWYDADVSKGSAALELCLKDAYKHAGIDEKMVNECIEDSGTLTKDNDNVMLEEQLKSQRDFGIMVAPTVWANGHGLHWRPIGASSVLASVCDGYHTYAADGGASASPQVCQTCNHKTDAEVVTCAKQFYDNHSKHSHHHHKRGHHRGLKIFFWVVFWMGLIGVAGYFLYQKLVQGQDGARLGALSDGLRYAMLSDQNNPDTVG